MDGHQGVTDEKPSGAQSVYREKRVRLFVAIELPEFVKEALSQLQAEIRQSGFPAKWSAAENIHLTLMFLGETPVSRVEDIGRQLADAAAGFPPITLWAAGLSVFPGVKRPRVLWTGVRGETDRLSRLQNRVEDNLSAIGFDKEDRGFTPHLTLARFKGKIDPETVISAITCYGDFASRDFQAGALCLFESRLTPRGPVYTCRQTHLLAGRAEE